MIVGAHRERRTLDQPAYVFAYRSDFRGGAAPLLSDRATLLKQWDRRQANLARRRFIVCSRKV